MDRRGGVALHPLDRALTILARCHPELHSDAIADLPIGERDRLLLHAREQTLGPAMRGFAGCGACGEPLEYELQTPDILSLPGPGGAEREWTLDCDGLRVRYRLPTSRDLATAALAPDRASATRTLGRCCVVAVERDGAALDVDDELVATLSGTVADAIRAREPLSELVLELSCPRCGHATRTIFDIAAFFWEEIAAMARRLLVGIDTLARVYHWSEAAILALSPQRRQWYLELAHG